MRLNTAKLLLLVTFSYIFCILCKLMPPHSKCQLTRLQASTALSWRGGADHRHVRDKNGPTVQKPTATTKGKSKVKTIPTKSKKGKLLNTLKRESVWQSLLNYLDKDRVQQNLRQAMSYSSLAFNMLLSSLFWPKDKHLQSMIIKIGRMIYFSYLVFYQLILVAIENRINSLEDGEVILNIEDSHSVARKQLRSSLGFDIFGMVSGGLTGQVVDEGNNSKSLTIADYDKSQLQSLRSGLLFDIARTSLFHFLTSSNSVLFLNPLSGLLDLLYNPLFRIHVVGQKAEGNFMRPFQKPSISNKLMSMIQFGDEDSEATDEEDTEFPK